MDVSRAKAMCNGQMTLRASSHRIDSNTNGEVFGRRTMTLVVQIVPSIDRLLLGPVDLPTAEQI
jgi:hypothetical protein